MAPVFQSTEAGSGSDAMASSAVAVAAFAPTCVEHRGRSTRSERPQTRKRNHPRPRLMDTSRVDGVKAPLHNGTPRSYASMFMSNASNVVDLLNRRKGEMQDMGKTDVRISVSRRVETPSRHRRDSCPSDEVVGGFFFDFGAVPTASSDRDAPRRWMMTN